MKQLPEFGGTTKRSEGRKEGKTLWRIPQSLDHSQPVLHCYCLAKYVTEPCYISGQSLQCVMEEICQLVDAVPERELKSLLGGQELLRLRDCRSVESLECDEGLCFFTWRNEDGIGLSRLQSVQSPEILLMQARFFYVCKITSREFFVTGYCYMESCPYLFQKQNYTNKFPFFHRDLVSYNFSTIQFRAVKPPQNSNLGKYA